MHRRHAGRHSRFQAIALTSALKGMESKAPILVTDRDEAAVANLTDSAMPLPSDKATHNAPQNVSPAAVVSTASTFLAGTSSTAPSPQTSDPLEPRVTITDLAPLDLNRSAAVWAESTLSAQMPVSREISVSFGIIKETYL